MDKRKRYILAALCEHFRDHRGYFSELIVLGALGYVINKSIERHLLVCILLSIIFT